MGRILWLKWLTNSTGVKTCNCNRLPQLIRALGIPPGAVTVTLKNSWRSLAYGNLQTFLTRECKFCKYLSLASQKTQSQSLRFQIANSKSQLSPQVPRKNRRKIAEWNRKSLRFEIASSKSQCLSVKQQSWRCPNFQKYKIAAIFGGRDFKSQRFRGVEIAAFLGC